MSINPDALQTVKKQILDELHAVEIELADLGFAPDGAVEVTFDEGFADAAQTTSERAKAMSLAEGLMHRLADARAALARIDKGTYGICASCGQPISPERLEAIPTATLCIVCKQKTQSN